MRLALRHLLVLALAVSTSPLVAQNTPPKPTRQPTSPTPKTPPATGRLIGTVICSDTGKPARGAPIYLNGYEAKTYTDADGHYEFHALKPGTYELRVRSIGYLASLHREVKVTFNETSVLNLTAERGSALSGRVTFSDGSPAIRAFIRVEDAAPKKSALSDDSPEGRLHVGEIYQLLTDDTGYFRVSGYAPGTYRVAAVPRLKSGRAIEPDTSLALAVFSASTTHRSEAKTYVLRAGEDFNDIQIVIPLDIMHKVQGTVFDKDGRVINSGNVLLVDKSDKSIRFAVSLEDGGRFFFEGVPSGRYEFKLTNAAIEIPDPSDDLDRIKTNFFAEIRSSVIVNDSDTLDLRFEAHEIPKPPEPPDDDN